MKFECQIKYSGPTDILDSLAAGIPMMSADEIAMLARHLTRDDRVFEWGSGASTRWLAARVAHVTAVEHQSVYASYALATMPKNVSLVYEPPNLPYDDGAATEDGDHETFRSYVESYTGRRITAVLIDGRARVACAREVALNAKYGPFPGMRVFVHDADRAEYSRIWEDGEWGQRYFDLAERVDNLALLRPIL